MVSAIPRWRDDRSDGPTVVDTEPAVGNMLAALEDADCRRILETTSDEARSASEVATACDMPLSTTYRKLDTLSEAGLLYERTRIRRSGKHVSEYVRLVDDVVVSVGDGGGVELRVSHRPTAPPTPRFG